VDLRGLANNVAGLFDAFSDSRKFSSAAAVVAEAAVRQDRKRQLAAGGGPGGTGRCSRPQARADYHAVTSRFDDMREARLVDPWECPGKLRITPRNPAQRGAENRCDFIFHRFR